MYRVNPQREGLAKHFTTALEAVALLLLRQMPVAAVARHAGIKDKRMYRMRHSQVVVAWPKVDWSGVRCVGCDKLSARKGQR